MASARTWVYFFGKGKADGRADQKALLGGKGAGLAEMTRIGLPVPAGFTLSTEACAASQKASGKWPSGLDKQVRQMLTKLERACKKKFGDRRDPLLVSVRSGAAISMPGMMETILNLGLNDKSVEGLGVASGNRRFALDAYRRLIMMYGATAKGIDRRLFDVAFDDVKHSITKARLGGGQVGDTDINETELDEIVHRFKGIYQQQTGEDFPQDPMKQLRGAIDAVFGSWNAEKAVTYRRVEKISGLGGTAVNVCQMVFGNMGDDSGTGVCFTRDPSTGSNIYYGDLLINAQGEDVVAGVRTPLPLSDLATLMPEAYDQLEAVRVMLEVHYKEMQDLEFTIERGTLYMLQCRSGKRSPAATFKIAVDQATTGVVSAATARRLAKKKYLPKRYVAAASKAIITREEAVARIKPEDIERLFYPILDTAVDTALLKERRLGQGINAVPGAACGEIVFSAEAAEAKMAGGAGGVILVRHETSPEDVGGMAVAVGILTATGGKTSHAAVVARGWGKCCIVGCDSLRIDDDAQTMSMNGKVLGEGDFITLDGGTGEIYEGRFDLVEPTAPAEHDTLMGWCDKIRRLKVRANADTPADATRARELGAEGIGLCRTEHMFFDSSEPQRIRGMREMILATTEDARRAALAKLVDFQQSDFEGLFEAMDGLPVTIRLLDPPLHEFLPAANNRQAFEDLLDDINAPVRAKLETVDPGDSDGRAALEGELSTIDDLLDRVVQLHETNPMLGHRGCRLSITFPEILDMQVAAIIEGAVKCTDRGIKVLPEIMIPLTIDGKELSILTDRTRALADKIIRDRGCRKLKYMIGTMIETPRAALLADDLAVNSEFFSFGTNDLTQMTMGLSRDDAGRFLSVYVDQDKAAIFREDPFQTLDVDGVGALVETAIKKGRSARPGIKLGICGEHGGDAESVRFFHRVGLDYVSCSPLRIPIARLAAAQAVLEERAGTKRPIQKSKSTKPKRAASTKSKPKKTTTRKTKKKR